MTGHWLIYVRRSYKKIANEDESKPARTRASAETSDEVQLEKCLALLPEGSTHEVFTDSGGHQSGRSDKRDGWQAVIARVQDGGVAGIVAYDISRLARNARLVLNLHHALEQTGADLRIAQMPGTDLTSAQGRFLLTILAGAAAFQADYDSQRMKDMMRATFEAGGHRGNDPLGYKTVTNERGDVVHDGIARVLEIVPEEAAAVRRAFELMTTLPFSEAAEALNREGAPRRLPGPWTNSSVKDLWRRHEFYIGRVTTKRGLESREGRHPAILTEDEYRAAVVGVTARMRVRGRRSSSHRNYLLRGRVRCECGARMRGATQSARGDTWRYYACPVSEKRTFQHDAEGNLVACHARRVRAVDAEAFVLDALSSFVVPQEQMDAAARELRQRLATGQPGGSDKERSRLTKRLEALRKQHEWGEIEDDEFRKAASEVRGQLAGLPGENGKVLEFARYRRVASSLPDAIAAAHDRPDLIESLMPLLVERVEIKDRAVAKVVWTPQARPFFVAASVAAEDEPALFERPRTDSEVRWGEALDWWVGASQAPEELPAAATA